MSALQPPRRRRQPRSTRLADLLSTAAAQVAKMAMDEPEGEMAPRREQEASPPAIAISRVRETTGPMAMRAATILQARETAEPLDARTAAILSAERETIPGKYDGLLTPRSEMVAIYDPPSSMRHKFTMWRWGKAETPLAFHSALLSLSQAAFPNMDHMRLDSLVLEQLLAVARDMDVFLPASEDDDLTSLKVACCLQARSNLRWRDGVVACTKRMVESGAKQEEKELPAVCVSLAGSQWARTGAKWRQEQRQPGHINAGYRIEPRQLVAPSSFSTLLTSTPPRIQRLTTTEPPVTPSEGLLTVKERPIRPTFSCPQGPRCGRSSLARGPGDENPLQDCAVSMIAPDAY
ncbi:unnamed protein product [Lampetra fluviatilis]